jgi:hypothetical protein
MAAVASLSTPQEQPQQQDDDVDQAPVAAAAGSSSSASSSSKRHSRAAAGSSGSAAVAPHCTLRTKATPVYSLRYTDRNLLLVGGAFSVNHSSSSGLS